MPLSEEGNLGRLLWMCTEICRSSFYAHKMSSFSLSILKMMDNRNIVYWEPTQCGVQNHRLTLESADLGFSISWSFYLLVVGP